MGKRILLADDSVTIQKVVELTFMDEDYEVVAVSNGDDAVARLADTNPDLVIADVHMPGADGYEVARRVKQWRGHTPVLLLVGTFEPFHEEDAKRSGADGFLKKPFDSQELLRRVEELLTAAASAGAGQGAIAADEMASWQAPPEPALEAEGAGDLYGGGTAGDEPAGPLGQPVPEELVLEASPWTEAEESAPAAWSPPAEPAPPPVAPPAPRPTPRPAPAPAAPSSARAADGGLSEADVDRIARRVVELLGEQLVREVAWEVVPDMAELVIKDRIRELERQLESP